MIQQQTKDKSCCLLGVKSSLGICASIAIAECILRSEWGEHIVSRKENNLFLLEKDNFTRGKGIEFEGLTYKTYDNWLEFSIDLSDYYINTKKYDEVLMAKNLDQQLDLLPKVEGYCKDYCSKIEVTIEKYGLWEFDLFY